MNRNQAIVQPPAHSTGGTRYILACVDGTDSAKWRQSNTLGGTKPANYSHIWQISREFRVGQGGFHIPYMDGPELSGKGSAEKVSTLVRNVTDFVKRQRANGVKFRPSIAQMQCSMDTPKYDFEIVMFGHSRGAVICGDAAAKLKTLDVGVYFIGLFDAVDRAYALDGGASSNVLFTYHARRDPSAQRMTAIPSRHSFGNDMESSLNNYQQAYFQTSHGGVGGSPALDYDQLGIGADYSCAGHSQRRARHLARVDDALLKYPTLAKSNPQIVQHRQYVSGWLERGSSVAQMCVQQSQAAYDWMVAKARAHQLPV